MPEFLHLNTLISTVVYAFVGIILLVLAYLTLEKLTPEKSWREISQNNNIALAIVLAAYIISMGMIISAAITG